MSEVFISYKQEERDKMRPIAAALRALKVDVWFDERLSPDKAFTEEIEDVANRCGAQLVCWSPAAVKSEWVRGEAEVGRQRGSLVQAMIMPCTLSPPFNVIHAENISDWRGQPEHAGWQKILDTIGRKIGRPGLAELALLQDSPISEDWKKWAAKYANDPFAEDAWAKAQALHLDAERGRMAQEWQATRKAAQDAEAKRRMAAETRSAGAPRSAQIHEVGPPPRSNSMPLIAGLAVAAIAIAGGLYYFAPRANNSGTNNIGTAAQAPLDPALANVAHTLEGRWRLEGQNDCSQPYTMSLNGSQLLLTGPDSGRQRGIIDGVQQGWLRTIGRSGVSSYFQRRGRVLAFRYSSIHDEAGESRFSHCE